MDPLLRVTTIACTPNPQSVVYAAMHQDYSDGYVADESPKDEAKAGEIIVKRLLKGEPHFGPLEHPQITFAVGYCPHSVMQQARTHRVGTSFDCQCLSGSMEVTFVDIKGSSSKKLKKTMSELYDLWTNGERVIRERKIKGRNGEKPGFYRRDMKKRIKGMRIRCLDESSNIFTQNHIEDIVFNGINPVYKVTLADGKVLECTQNHKIYTPYGWRILAQLSVGSQVMVNGVPLKDAEKTYQNKEWLKSQFSKGLIPREVAAILGCSTESVKKWAYKHDLTWTTRQWNKGSKYQIVLSQEERIRRANQLRKINEKRSQTGSFLYGESHGSWKDLPVEKRVYNWLKYARKSIIEQKGGVCVECGTTEKIHCHHIRPVRECPDLAYDLNNIELLCSSCHSRHHHKGSKNPLCAHPVEIVAIEYKGVEPTYDLVLASPHHNFIANGVVVHNSFRYTGDNLAQAAQGQKDIEEVIYFRPIGQYTDRSGKRYFYSEEMRNEDKEIALSLCGHYTQRIEHEGLSNEHARGMLPFDYRQHFVVSFNARSLMHFLDLRAKTDAQLEIRWLCELMFPLFKEWMPAVAGWYEANRLGKGRLAP